MVYTDVWASMGQKEEAEKRKRVFKDSQAQRSGHCFDATRQLVAADSMGRKRFSKDIQVGSSDSCERVGAVKGMHRHVADFQGRRRR